MIFLENISKFVAIKRKICYHYMAILIFNIVFVGANDKKKLIL